jgi:cob(I)alamin adenosyltransferase
MTQLIVMLTVLQDEEDLSLEGIADEIGAATGAVSVQVGVVKPVDDILEQMKEEIEDAGQD